uniref:Em1-tg10 n=1 Tax=Euplotes aediculatus TaxID=5940 RepID=Q1PPX4_EUPAE|nr:em1-tg10 [Euplotes aediculatus]
MSSICHVCYASSSMPLFCCGFQCCNRCIISWTVARLPYCGNHNFESVPCVNQNCTINWKTANLAFVLSVSDFEEINKSMTRIYFTNCIDASMCPNKNCKYVGFVSKARCSEEYICSLCETHWRDQHNRKNKVIPNYESFQEFCSFSKMLITSIACPHCEYPICK